MSFAEQSRPWVLRPVLRGEPAATPRATTVTPLRVRSEPRGRYVGGLLVSCPPSDLYVSAGDVHFIPRIELGSTKTAFIFREFAHRIVGDPALVVSVSTRDGYRSPKSMHVTPPPFFATPTVTSWAWASDLLPDAAAVDYADVFAHLAPGAHDHVDLGAGAWDAEEPALKVVLHLPAALEALAGKVLSKTAREMQHCPQYLDLPPIVVHADGLGAPVAMPKLKEAKQWRAVRDLFTAGTPISPG